MKIKYEDTFFQYLSNTFMGVEMTFRKNKQTGELLILMTDEIAQQIFGFESVEKLIQNKKIQELTQEYHDKTKDVIFKPAIDFRENDFN